MTATPRIYSDDTKAGGEGRERRRRLDGRRDGLRPGVPPARVRRGGREGPAHRLQGPGPRRRRGDRRQHLPDAASPTRTSELNLDDAAKIVGCWNGLAKRPATLLTARLRGRPSADAPRRRLRPDHQGLQGRSPPNFNDHRRCLRRRRRGRAHAARSTTSTAPSTRCERNQQLDWLKQDPGPAQRPHPVQRPLPVRRRRRARPRRGHVPAPAQVGRRRRPVRRPRHAQAPRQVVRLHHPAGRHPRRAVARRGAQGQRAVQGRLAGPPGPARPRRPVQREINQIELNKKAPQNIGIGHVGPATSRSATRTARRRPARTQEPQDRGQAAQRCSSLCSRSTTGATRSTPTSSTRSATAATGRTGRRTSPHIAERHITRIKASLDPARTSATRSTSSSRAAGNLNESVTEADAIEMLAQHLITKPVFDALFGGYAFAEHNPVSKAMERCSTALDEQSLETENKRPRGFYDSVRRARRGHRQRRGQASRSSSSSTTSSSRPRSQDRRRPRHRLHAGRGRRLHPPHRRPGRCARQFGRSLSDEGVHILDPFTGTGTFIVRLLQSGLIKPEDLPASTPASCTPTRSCCSPTTSPPSTSRPPTPSWPRRPASYVPFEGIVLTDTFQLDESGELSSTHGGTSRTTASAPRGRRPSRSSVIIGNPPYSWARTARTTTTRTSSTRPRRQHRRRPTRRDRPRRTRTRSTTPTSAPSAGPPTASRTRASSASSPTAASSTATRPTASASRWPRSSTPSTASTSAATSAPRRAVAEGGRQDLRRRQPEHRRHPLLVKSAKDAAGAGCTLHYRDIGDYLTREEKLAHRSRSGPGIGRLWDEITPNEDGDWINQRDERLRRVPAIGEKDETLAARAIFDVHSSGLETGRDAWVYNFSESAPRENIESMIDFYNEQVGLSPGMPRQQVSPTPSTEM